MLRLICRRFATSGVTSLDSPLIQNENGTNSVFFQYSFVEKPVIYETATVRIYVLHDMGT